MIAVHLDRIEHLEQTLTQVQDRIGRIGKDGTAGGLVEAFTGQIALLMTIPGIGERVATPGHRRDRGGHVPLPQR